MCFHRLRLTLLTTALGAASLILAQLAASPLVAAECYLMLYLGADEQNAVGVSEKLEGLEKGSLPALDADAPAYFVLVEGMTMALVESAAREEGGSEDVAGSSAGPAIESASEVASMAADSMSSAPGAAQDASHGDSKKEVFRTFVPRDEIGLGYFCPDGSDEGDSWSAPGGHIHAMTKGNNLVIGLTKKGASLPR